MLCQTQSRYHDELAFLFSAGGDAPRVVFAALGNPMTRATAYLLLVLAAILEAGGDALVRVGLHASGFAARAGMFAAGAAALFCYALSVNAPNWDFGKLLGVYVTLFFVVAQLINLVVFGVRPDLPVLVGGALIVAGGLVVTVWDP